MSRDEGGPRRPKPISAAYLDRAAIFYLQRYATSAANLHRVLLRKARRQLDPNAPPGPDLEPLVAETVARALRQGLLDDTGYAEAKVASLMRRGASPGAIRARLRQKGVPDAAIAGALEANPPDDLALARRLAQRRRLGPWRNPARPPQRDRDLAILCRAGFPYRVACAALDGARD